MKFTYATPRPRASISIRLGRLPRYAELAIALVAMAVIIGTVCLIAANDPESLRIPKLPKPANVSVAIQQHVDSALKGKP